VREKGFDHLAHAFLHLVADGAFADENREPVQIFRVLASQFDVLNDLDQDFVAALFEGRGVAQVVFHFGTRRRPFESFR
jgi:hypothetical protein